MTPGEMDSLHERLVAYVHTLEHGSRRGVWGEHSYARARIGAARGGTTGGGGAAPRVRTLLAPLPPRPISPLLDVDTEPSPPPSPPGDDSPPPDDDDDTDAEDTAWEERVLAAAPGAQHARLVDAVAATLRAMRLARLTAPGRFARREQARTAARRLRLALAPLWGGGAPAWLHAALLAQLPRAERRLYEEALEELRRGAPRLVARLAGPRPAAPPVPRAPRVGPESSPWLVWVSSGSAALDARWEPRLAALVHTRVLRAAAGEAAAPAAWCAAAAGAARAALTDALAEAGSRAVVLGGLGAGCAVALVLARGAGGAGRAEGGVRGLVLAAPALLTAEGARDAAEDALAACRLPLLLVAGSGAAACARGAAHAVAERGRGRRLLEVRGADDELRLPARLRARRRLPQHALDAALVEECVRWAVETAERDDPPPDPAPRRAHPAHPAHDIDLTDEEYAHLPSAAPTTKSRSELSENPAPALERRVVSRVSGGTPLALLPPRRAPPAGAAGAAGAGAAGAAGLAAADIMQLPIVFADDEPAASTQTGAEPGGAITVTSGHSGKGETEAGPGADAGCVKFTRVILAKRGVAGAGAAAARPLLLRRGVRLVPRRPQ